MTENKTSFDPNRYIYCYYAVLLNKLFATNLQSKKKRKEKNIYKHENFEKEKQKILFLKKIFKILVNKKKKKNNFDSTCFSIYLFLLLIPDIYIPVSFT